WSLANEAVTQTFKKKARLSTDVGLRCRYVLHLKCRATANNGHLIDTCDFQGRAGFASRVAGQEVKHWPLLNLERCLNATLDEQQT
ncbi:jg688, partial [Pararge aegeria aegeria]